HLLFGERHQIAAGKPYFATGNAAGRVGNEAHDRQRADRFARAALADDRHRLARVDGVRNAVDSADDPRAGAEFGMQFLDFQERRHAHIPPVHGLGEVGSRCPARLSTTLPGRGRCAATGSAFSSAAPRIPGSGSGPMADVKWAIRGEYMESCNCDYLCPCIYTNPQGPVTYDHCTAALVFRIDAGSYGDTKLGGLKFALVIRSGKVMADGNWIFAGVVDERADDAQRQALAAIVGGQAGGPPANIRENLVSDFRGVEIKPIEFTLDGLKRSTAISDLLSFE